MTLSADVPPRSSLTARCASSSWRRGARRAAAAQPASFVPPGGWVGRRGLGPLRERRRRAAELWTVRLMAAPGAQPARLGAKVALGRGPLDRLPQRQQRALETCEVLGVRPEVADLRVPQ